MKKWERWAWEERGVVCWISCKHGQVEYRQIDDSNLPYKLVVPSRFKVIKRICELQKEYIVSGDPLSLRLISQKELAKEFGRAESSITRMVRGRIIRERKIKIVRDSTEEILPLKILCNNRTIKQILVKAVAAKYPKEPDGFLQSLLRIEYGVEISRRTVAYHRNKPFSEFINKYAPSPLWTLDTRSVRFKKVGRPRRK